MFWCQIEGICVDNLTECYFPGAIAWASCTVGPIVTKLPTCRYLLHFGFAKNSFFILTNLQLVLLSRQRRARSGARTTVNTNSAGPYDDFGYCIPEDMKCPDGFLKKRLLNCFSCVINGNSWITNFSSDTLSPPNILVCLPPEGVAKFSFACPVCGIGFEYSIYEKLWQCQLASCAACTYSNFVWCSSESRCANAIESCTDRKSGI
jgi:hypothetical protein